MTYEPQYWYFSYRICRVDSVFHYVTKIHPVTLVDKWSNENKDGPYALVCVVELTREQYEASTIDRADC